MPQATPDLSSFFTAEFTRETVDGFADAAYANYRTREQFDSALQEQRAAAKSGEAALRVGVGLLILGSYRDALETLAGAPAEKLRHYYAAQACLGLGRIDEAIAELTKAAAKGWDGFECDMLIAAAQVRAGDAAAADKTVQKHARSGADRAGWYYVQGLLAEARDEREEAVNQFEKALTLDPDHCEASFRCARLYDLLGDDRQATELYERLALQPRAHVNALLNLAVMYEDCGRFDESIACLHRVLKTHPSHARARLFLKDVESSRQMVIDEIGDQKAETRNRLLDTPIVEFELSVRARNCLKKMRIQTLGDLLRQSEAELLAYKNFGETSLNEIKALLTNRGLRLGQRPEEIDLTVLPPPPAPKVTVPAGSEAVLGKPVSELELSVRARRCLQRLNISTLGDLIQHSESDLLASRNFGVTSLNEIKARLTEFGLGLAAKR